MDDNYTTIAVLQGTALAFKAALAAYAVRVGHSVSQDEFVRHLLAGFFGVPASDVGLRDPNAPSTTASWNNVAGTA